MRHQVEIDVSYPSSLEQAHGLRHESDSLPAVSQESQGSRKQEQNSTPQRNSMPFCLQQLVEER